MMWSIVLVVEEIRCRTHNLLMMKTIACLVLLLLSSVFGKRTNYRSRELDTLVSGVDIVCRITVIDTMYERDVHDEYASHSDDEFGCIPIRDDETEAPTLLSVRQLPDYFTLEHERSIAEGMLVVALRNVTIDGSSISLDKSSKLEHISTPGAHLRHLQGQSTRNIYIVRVSTVDSSPVPTLEEIEVGMFHSSPSFKSQYDACSFGSLSWDHAGSIDIQLINSIADFSNPGDILAAAQATVEHELNVDSVKQLADHVLFCQPPMKGWIASAAVNHWRMNFNGDWCLSLSALIHEAGHNLGLSHSGKDGDKYLDKTCYMGYGKKRSDGPLKCFNGYKHFKLGWYSDRTVFVDPSTPATVTLAAFVDYKTTSPNEAVIVNIADTLFLQYNRAKAFNIGTEDHIDLVTVTMDTPGWSTNLAGLGVSSNFVIDDFLETGKNLVIKVCEKTLGFDSMVVSIGFDQSYCKEAPAASPTWLPNSSPSGGSCNELREVCFSHADCCENLRCLFRSDEFSCRHCRQPSQSCDDDSDCCDGLLCDHLEKSCYTP